MTLETDKNAIEGMFKTVENFKKEIKKDANFSAEFRSLENWMENLTDITASEHYFTLQSLIEDMRINLNNPFSLISVVDDYEKTLNKLYEELGYRIRDSQRKAA